METATIDRVSIPSAGVPGSRRTTRSQAPARIDPPSIVSAPETPGGVVAAEGLGRRSHNPPGFPLGDSGPLGSRVTRGWAEASLLLGVSSRVGG